jgi:transposase
MKNIYVAGDISKEKIDFSVYDGTTFLITREVKNSKREIKKFIKEIDDFFNSSKKENLFENCYFVFEYTGIYNNLILDVLEAYNYKVALLHPGVLKAVSGIDRAKNDKIDAKRIAEYAHRFLDRLNFHEPICKEIKELRHLISFREGLIKSRSSHTQKLDDMKKFYPADEYAFYKNQINTLVKSLDDSISDIENKIIKIIKGSEALKENYYNAMSVPGIGPVTAVALIVFTNNFTKFTNSKQLGSYCGVVPFARSSGVYKGKDRLSMKANKTLKTLLHMGALSVSGCKNQFGQYYNKKVADGKNKMLALNNLRNKILKTVFSCVTKKEKYKADYKFSFAA